MAPYRELNGCRVETSRASVQWLGPDASRDQRRLDAWCATVGPLLVSLQPRVNPDPATDVTVVTWNVHGGAGDVVELVTRLREGRLTNGHPVRSFVLLLQETYRTVEGQLTPQKGAPQPRAVGQSPTRHAQEIAGLAERLGLAVVYAPAMRNGSGNEDRGNAILSTLPLDDIAVIELPFERQRRLAVAATVNGTFNGSIQWRLRVVAAHLDTGLLLWRGGGDRARVRQAAALLDALPASAPPLVVGGDFNTEWNAQEPAFATIDRDLPNARQPGEMTWRGPLGLRRQLDYLFARVLPPALAVSRVADRLGSDHHALVVTIPVAALEY